MDGVNFGIIGSGLAWQLHRIGLKNDPRLKFTAIFDIDEEKGKRFADVGEMKYFNNIDKFLKSEIDAVLIMLPHYLHEEYVRLAAEAGKHILCEKPMATTLEGCDQMINDTKKAGVKFMIAENHRFLPAHQYIMDAVQSGLIGDVFLVRAHEGVNEIEGLMREGFWKGHPILAGGGALMDMGVHKFVTLNWILNDTVDSMYSWLTKQCTNLPEKAEDNAMLFLKFKKHTIAEIVLSFSVVSPQNNSLELYGTQGTIIENHMFNNPIRIFSNHKKMGKEKKKWFEPEIEHGPMPAYYAISMWLQDLYFAECIINDVEPEFTPEQAKEAIATALLGYLSAINNKVTYMEELLEIYRTKGTKSILNQIGNAVKENFCV